MWTKALASLREGLLPHLEGDSRLSILTIARLHQHLINVLETGYQKYLADRDSGCTAGSALGPAVRRIRQKCDTLARACESAVPLADEAGYLLVVETIGNEDVEQRHAFVVVLDVGDGPTLRPAAVWPATPSVNRP